MVSFTFPAPANPHASPHTLGTASSLSAASIVATRGSSPVSFAEAVARNVEENNNLLGNANDDPEAPPCPAPLSDMVFWPPLKSSVGGGKAVNERERSPSIEIIEKPAVWATPIKKQGGESVGWLKKTAVTTVKSEPVTPDLRSAALIAAIPDLESPADPEQELGKHDRPDSPSSPSKSSRKKRRTRKSRSPSHPPALYHAVAGIAVGHADSDLKITKRGNAMGHAAVPVELDDEGTGDPENHDVYVYSRGAGCRTRQGEGLPPVQTQVVGDRACGEAQKIEAGWSNMFQNGLSFCHTSLLESISQRSPESSHPSIILGPTRPTSAIPSASDRIASPRPIYPDNFDHGNSINATMTREDTVMRSPSPTITQIMRERIPRHQKGKGRDMPPPGPSRPAQIQDSFYSQIPEERQNRPSLFNPDDTTCSVFPPQTTTSLPGLFTRTPTHPASIIDQYQMFESTMASRGPPISRTLYASEFPAHGFTTPQQPPIPPQPYVEEGEIIEEIEMGGSSLRDFVQQQAENAPAEQDDFLTMMPTPAGGFPPVHFTTPLGAYANTMDKQLLDWEMERRSGLVTLGVSFYGFGALDGDIDPRYRQLLSYAAHTLNARFHTNRIMIAKPQPKVPVSQLNSAPHTALLYGLKADEASLLEQEGVMCTTRLAMFFHKLDVAYPEFVGAIHGLTTRLIHPVYDMVVNHFTSPEAEALFRELSTRPPNPIASPDQALAYFLNTMYVRRLDCRARGNTHAPVYLVYMRSPATDYHSFRAWSAFCRKMNLTHSLYGTGHLKSPGVCAGCHGQDHPSGLCRFARLDGWLAPPPNTPPNFSIPAPPSTQEHAPPQPRGNGNGNGQQSRPRRRKGNNGRSQHTDTPRP